jgi:protein-glutamine gamma-glutamyltransferase
MSPRARETELLLLAAFAAVPLYFTGAVGVIPLILYHVALLVMVVRVARGKGPDFVSVSFMRGIGLAYVVFYFIDAAVISRSAIAASTHLVLFISLYQPIDGIQHDNRAQRLLTTTLIFVASVATSTDITIVLFVIAFAFAMFRQLMYVSHAETARSIGREYADVPSGRAAAFYLCGATLIGVVLFPLLPRVRNPLVHGLTGTLTNATTGLSNSIDFNQDRTSTPDAGVVARIWMGQEAVPFFTPLRLRGAAYDRYLHNTWLQSPLGYRYLVAREGVYPVARPVGFTRSAHVQQRLIRTSRVFLPVGTYAVSGLGTLLEGPAHNSYATSQFAGAIVNFDVSMARSTRPLRQRPPTVVNYPITPAVAALARTMVGNRNAPAQQAAAIEEYMSRHFQYVARPEQIGRTMTTDEFLLNHRRGHCEYFAAGMVALMSALNVPARIVGGYYGGRFNPLTGYFVLRNEDAHAWVEVWTGDQWETFDPTPATLRPGNAQDGLLQAYASALADSVNYFWDRYVLTYGLGDQIALAAEVIGRLRDSIAGLKEAGRLAAKQITILRVVVGTLFPVILALMILFARRRRPPLFDLLAAHLRLLGIEVGPTMTMEEALDALRSDHPDAARELEPLIKLYEAERFSAERDRSRVVRIRRRLAELRE